MTVGCDFPPGEKFRVIKDGDPGDHTPWYVIMPGGACLSFSHHTSDAVDEARARWFAEIGNAALRCLE